MRRSTLLRRIQTDTFTYDGYQCYAGDQGTLCSKGHTQFTALI